MSKKYYNPVKKMMEQDRRWGVVHKNKKKYNREPPNHHALDEEIEEALDAQDRKPD